MGARMRPEEVARLLVGTAREYGVNRVAISGGEPTLNREFLVEFVRKCREYGGPDLRVHVDTNGTVLSPDYVDELVEAGMTDIGIDVKGFRPETFAEVAGIDVKEAAEYVDGVLRILEYLADEYLEEVFVGVGVPYNPELVDKEEVFALTDWLYEHLGEDVQVCYLDYRPEFRRRDLPLPKYEDMVELEEYAKSLGFRRVHAQKVSVRR
jgi:pyruvate formate lyase activating enzyme